MDFLETQLDIVKKFVGSTRSSICYVSAQKSLFDKIPDQLGNSFVVIDLLYDFSPFKPFLSILSQKSPDESVVRKSSYSLQADSFLSYFRNGYADERYDIPLDNEFVYETNRFIQTICALIRELNDTNYLIMNAQLLQQNSLELLKELEKYPLQGKFVLCFNSDDTEESARAAIEFFDRNRNKHNFLYLKDRLSNDTFFPSENSFDDIASKVLSDYNSVFKNLRNNRIFMSHDQLLLVVNWTVKHINDFKLNQKKFRELSLEIALAYYTCLQYDNAILHFNDVIESHVKDELSIAALYYLVSIFYYKKSGDFARRHANHLQELLEDNKTSPYYSLFQMVVFQFTANSDLQKNVENYRNIMQLLEKSGLINNYISTGLSIPWSLIDDDSNRAFVYGNIEKCYALAKQIGNQHLVSKACHWKGIIHSHYGESDEVMKWYFECNQIRTEIGEIGPIMNIRNGLSYESTRRAKYENAYNLVNDVIKNLYNMNDYSNVIDTLKNIGYALFYSRHFAQADTIFTKILHYLHLFSLEKRPSNSFLPSVNDMLIFKSIIEFNENDYIHARINYTRILQDPNGITSEDKPLLHFIKAALLLENGDVSGASSAVDQVISEFELIRSDQSHKICFVCYEFAVMLNKMGLIDESDKYLEIGFNLAKQKSFEHYTKHLQQISVYDYLRDTHDFSPLNIDLMFLDEKADKEVLLTQLHKRIHDYQFLNQIKATNSKIPNLKQYIHDVSSAIFEFTLAESVFICECHDNHYETIHCVSRKDGASLDSETWWSLFKKNSSQSFSQLVYSAEENLYFANISQFDYRFGIAIAASKENPITTDYVNALNIAISNIQAQIIIFKQNENLLFLSTTDQLSLLNNRHAFQEYISRESNKIRRYRERKNLNIQISIAFIDLDNFKYYNDTFGHSAGDLLISCFAKLLKKTCRQIDFIARFGGDEFVILMVDTSIEEALKVNARLKENLKKQKFFIPDLEKHLEIENLDIPENKLIGFSMGISSNFDDNDFENLDKVMIKADQALYYSKEHCKGEPSVWKNISKELIQEGK